MYGRIATFAGVLIGALWLASGSSQAEGEVDCDSTALSLPAEFEAKCSTFSQPVHFSGESSAGPGTVYVEIMEASNMKAGVYLVVLSARLTATRFGYGSDSIKKNLGEFFQTLPVSEYSTIGNRSGFEVAEFVSSGDQCIAWQRYFNKSFGIYKRMVFGFGCSALGREPIYSALEVLETPGK